MMEDCYFHHSFYPPDHRSDASGAHPQKRLKRKGRWRRLLPRDDSDCCAAVVAELLQQPCVNAQPSGGVRGLTGQPGGEA